MNKRKLIRRISVGVASLALIVPLALSNAQFAPIHAEGGYSLSPEEKEEFTAHRHNKAAVDQERRDDRITDEADDSGEVAMIKLDPSEALTVQHDTPFYHHHKALVNHAQGLFTTDKHGNYKLKPKYRYTKHGNIVRRHRSHAHRAKRTRRHHAKYRRNHHSKRHATRRHNIKRHRRK